MPCQQTSCLQTGVFQTVATIACEHTNVSELPLDQKIQAVKFERLKETPVLIVKQTFLFDCSTLTAGIFLFSWISETYYTSF